MPDFRIPPEGIEVEGLAWPGGAEITVTDAYWAKRLAEHGAVMTHDGGVSYADGAEPAGQPADWFQPLPKATTEWDKPPEGDGDGDGEQPAGETPPAETGNRRRSAGK